MTIGQMSEIIFMLLIPFFFRRLGVKWMILVGMLSWVLRYLLFAFGAPDQAFWMIMLGVALHGICYDFFFVTGFMYTDAVAPKEVRSQAQSMLVFITQGLGMFIGYGVVFGRWGVPSQFGKVGNYGELNEDIANARDLTDLSVIEKFANMFAKSMPEGIDANLLAETMGQWKEFWILPAVMAAVITAVFLAAFWDNTQVTDEKEA